MSISNGNGPHIAAIHGARYTVTVTRDTQAPGQPRTQQREIKNFEYGGAAYAYAETQRTKPATRRIEVSAVLSTWTRDAT